MSKKPTHWLIGRKPCGTVIFSTDKYVRPPKLAWGYIVQVYQGGELDRAFEGTAASKTAVEANLRRKAAEWNSTFKAAFFPVWTGPIVDGINVGIDAKLYAAWEAQQKG